MSAQPKEPRRFFASGVPVLELARLTDFHVEFDALRTRGLERGISTGWRSLDELFTVRPREWTLVTGIPGHGKTTVIDALMVNLAKGTEAWHWAVFSAEQWPLERHAATLAGQFAGVPLNEMNDYQYGFTRGWIDEYFTFACPSEADYTMDHVLDLMLSAITDDPMIRGVVIDPWNELDHSRPSNMNETEYVSRCLTKIRRFVRHHEVHVFLVAHPTKLAKASDGGYPVPTPYDVSGSAHFRNKADNCLCVWRDVLDERNETDIHVQKIRFREVGKVGVCRLNYDWRSSRFIDPKPGIDELVERQELKPDISEPYQGQF